MALGRRQRFSEQSEDTKRYVGQRRQDVFAVGKDGQRLNISGTDAWTGGVGPVTNNEIFGGETMGADWTVTKTDAGHLVVGSRQAILVIGESNADAPTVNAKHSGSGTQDIDGNLTCIIWAKVRLDGNDAIGVDGLMAGFTEADGGVDRAVWKTSDGLTWTPQITSGGGTTSGAGVALLIDTWYRFKIVVKTGSTDFYIDDVLKENLAVAADNPDDSAMSGYMQLNGTGNDQTELRIRRFRVQYGST